jgi:hypothetical protein
LDSDLSSLDRKLVYYKEYSSSNPRGQYSSGNTKVYYAGLVDKQGGGSMGYLGFFDTEQDTIKNEFVFSDSILPYNKYFINSFQETLDGNFAFMNWLWQPDADLSLRFEIMKVDSEGQQIAKIEGRAIEEQPGLIQDEEGDFYFYTEATPFFKDSTVSFPDRSGGIAKASADLDTVLCSIQLNTEVDPSSEDRWNHTSLGFSRLTDGNLITYGEARQLTTAILAGYVCKFSPEGKILWIRYFPIEVEEEYLPENSRGYKASF